MYKRQELQIEKLIMYQKEVQIETLVKVEIQLLHITLLLLLILQQLIILLLLLIHQGTQARVEIQ